MTTTTNTSDWNIVHVLSGLFLLWLAWKAVGFFRLFKPRNEHSLRTVAVLVLGDIGRSPRMMYHAESFAENGFMTYLVGYGGSKPIPSLETLPKVQLCYLPEPPTILKSLPFVVAAPFKIAHQIASILKELLIRIPEPPEYLLVQNPPSIPTLALVALVARIRGCKVIIDWHNLGYSILALKLGDEHMFVKIAKWFEATFGQSAYAHLFVTEAMKEYLVEEWDLQGQKIVLHDRPPRHFRHSSEQEIHDLFIGPKSPLANQPALNEFLPESNPPYSSPFTDTSQPTDPSQHLISVDAPLAPPLSVTSPTYTQINPPAFRPDRPALVVSSTSWTPDEDFGILLDALKIYEERASIVNADQSNGRKLPKLLMAVTGKGPQREEYMARVNKLQESWNWVRCISVWLEAEKYPVFLGSAEMGVCLHSSSSALDLPMKVVDMFGCGLPVCALNFKCLPELVKHEKNGLIFNDSTELAEQLESLLTSFPDSPRLNSLRESLGQAIRNTRNTHAYSLESSEEWEWCSWSENWNHRMKPLVAGGVRI
ncbi:mannosyltransferase [Stygiomarasmius scandens]|uniref:Chitobiosyldiphosphodolichol beta-mannosyltransferase n=1 Tax=Marasmiellus scandens TaxID=2682957 RepID=A0ABR1JWM6_9AGAR